MINTWRKMVGNAEDLAEGLGMYLFFFSLGMYLIIHWALPEKPRKIIFPGINRV